METVIKFIKKNWYVILPWFLAIAFFIHILIKHEQVRIITPPIDTRIDSLSHVVDSLNASYTKLKQNYDSAQSNIRIEIQYIQIKNAKDISNIHNYTIDQRDSVWSTFTP